MITLTETGAGPRRRPRRPPRTGHTIEARFDTAEFAAVRDAAARRPGRGVSLSRFVADAAVSAATTAAGNGGGECGRCPRRERRAPSAVVLAEVMAATAAVNRVGNNLNQLAREQNATGLRPVGAREVERRVLAALSVLAEVVERAAGSGPASREAASPGEFGADGPRRLTPGGPG